MEDHTVRVSDDILKKLKRYKNKWSLSYNDIIDLSMKLLDGKGNKDYFRKLEKEQLVEMCDSLSSELEALRKKVPIEEVRAPVYKIKVSLNRVRINDSVKNLLDNGYDLFIPDITNRQAMYVKRKLKAMGYDCCYNKSEGDGKFGFLFTPLDDEPKNVDAVATPTTVKA